MVGRRIAGEYVIVPLAGRGADLDAILNFNRVATFIWERLDGRRSGRQVVTEIVSEFEVNPRTAARDYREFLAKLLDLKAIRSVTPDTRRS